MFHLKVGAANAQKVKESLAKAGLIDKRSLVHRIDGYVYFPIVTIDSKNIKNLLKNADAEIVRIPGRKATQTDYHTLLDEALGKDVKDINTGYDSLGNIAVIELPDLTKEKTRAFAQCIIGANPTVETVLAKRGPIEGEYRTRRLSYIAGKRTFIATYRENNCLFRFDARKTFFSGRLSYERKRIAQQVRKNENVMVMFAGMGPFAIEIAKMQPKSNVIGIELNRYAYEQMLENIKLNKASNVKAVFGDVRKKCQTYKGFADRIVMPLPKESTDFLDEAFKVARNGCVVHIYSFVGLGGGELTLMKKIRTHAMMNSCKVQKLFSRSVRPYSATEEEVVVDFRIVKR